MNEPLNILPCAGSLIPQPLHILLFSAARGARVAFKSHGQMICFNEMVSNPEIFRDGDYAIHPDDQLLRYGPISRQLFEAAKNPVANSNVYPTVVGTWWLNSDCQREYSKVTYKTRRMFLLMLAEELAWGGL